MELRKIIRIFLLMVILVCQGQSFSIEKEEQKAEFFMKELDKEINILKNREVNAIWDFVTNITDENEKRRNEISVENAQNIRQMALKIKKYDSRKFKNKDLKRKFKKLSNLGYAILSDEKYRELSEIVSKMATTYSQAKVCSYTDPEICDLELHPHIQDIVVRSHDMDELKYYWEKWHNSAGSPSKKSFERYVELAKEAAILNNFTSQAEEWLDEYEDNTFEKQLEDIMKQLRPFYEQLHGYIRFKLRNYYGSKYVSENGPIPIHLLGTLTAGSWAEITDLLAPYPHKSLIDVTYEMAQQGYTAKKMFEMGDDFFQSMNMTKLPDTFWEKSILEKPTDGRNIMCHPTAWDFFLDQDVRIKQCTIINTRYLGIAHHELGHIQYYLQYRDLPTVYREGANPGFHEAVGDVLALSVSTPKHLQKIGLLKNYVYDEETRINKLLQEALDKIIFIPYAYTVDKYRTAIFRGELKPEEYNCGFWKMRDEFSGVEPPVYRNSSDFDAGAIFHVSADIEYYRYMVAYVIQFQFYEALCKISGEFDPENPELPLDNCDIYNHPEAGNVFKKMLSLGSSKPWPDAMEVITGQRKMDAKAILNYFEPLRVWLENENKKNNVHIGWEKSDKCSN